MNDIDIATPVFKRAGPECHSCASPHLHTKAITFSGWSLTVSPLYYCTSCLLPMAECGGAPAKPAAVGAEPGVAVPTSSSLPPATTKTPVTTGTPSESCEVPVPTVDVHVAKTLIHSDHLYLDCRTVEEFNKGHVRDAINIPYVFFTPQGRVKNPQFLEQVSTICSKDTFIVVGCASGARSLQASKDLLNAGFKHVKNMGGGYAAWVENGFVVNKPLLEIAVPSA